jgi:four helix bundle protein
MAELFLTLQTRNFNPLGSLCSFPHENTLARLVCGLKLIVDMSESLICARAFEFGCRIMSLAEKLWERGPAARHIGSELMRCGPSVGANAEEAQDGQTKADFIAKLAISRKESRESRYWLRVAIKLGKVTKEEIAWELNEAGELRAMIVAAIKTAQSSSLRGQPVPSIARPLRKP